MKQVACHIYRWCIPAYRGPRDCAFRHEWPQALVPLGPYRIFGGWGGSPDGGAI